MRVAGFCAPQVGLFTAAVVFAGSMSVLLAYSPPGLRAPVERSAATASPAPITPAASTPAAITEVRSDNNDGAPGADAALAATPIGATDLLVGPLRDAAGQTFDLSALRGAPAVLFFTSMDCPITDDYQGRFADLFRTHAAEVGDGAVRFLALNQDVGPAREHDAREVEAYAARVGRPFPTLLDTDSAVAARLGVRVTPTVVVLDAAGAVRYRGPFDDSRDPAGVTRHLAADALRAVLDEDDATDGTLVAYRSK